MKQIFIYILAILIFSQCGNSKTNDQTEDKDSLKIDTNEIPRIDSDTGNNMSYETGYLQIVDDGDYIELINYSNSFDSVLSYNKIHTNGLILHNNPSYGEKKGRMFLLDRKQLNLYYFIYNDYIDENEEFNIEWVKFFKTDLRNFQTQELIKMDSVFPIVWCLLENENLMLFIDENHNLMKLDLDSIGLKKIDSLNHDLSNIKLWTENSKIKVSGHLKRKVNVITYDFRGENKTENTLGETLLSISHINNTAIKGEKFVELGNDSHIKGSGKKMIVNYGNKIDTIRVDFQGNSPYWIDSDRILVSGGDVQFLYNYKTHDLDTIRTKVIYVYQEVENHMLYKEYNDTLYYLTSLDKLKFNKINLKHNSYFDLYKLKPAPNNVYTK